MRPNQSRSRNRGLTIIELVVVVAVLAILAGFIVPRLGFVRNLASESGNATIIADSASQAVFYNTAVGHYPQGEDTLLTSAGTALDASLNKNLKSALTTVNLDSYAALSLAAQLTGSSTGGTVTLFNQTDDQGANPNLDDTTQVTFSATGTISSTGLPVPATLAGQTTVAQVNTATTYGQAIYAAAYGSAALTAGAPTDNTYLVALGYGANSQINGKTGLEAPVLFDKNNGEYTRPILLLKVFPSGSTAASVPPGTSATTSISIGFDASTVNTQLGKYQVDQAR